MANSNILIQFNAMPGVDNSIQINESKLGINLNEIFKELRISNGQVTIPTTSLAEYRMTISSIANILDIDVGFTPDTGIFTKTALSSVISTDNLDGTLTYSLNSSTAPVLFDNTTQTAILWSEGEFLYYGPVADYYTGFISENYRNALNSDYNLGNLFTIEAINGASGSGLGSVKITANYENAVFSFTNNAPASITVDNQAIVPAFNISAISFSNASTNQCQNVKVNATTNVLATKILSPFVLNGNTQNPFSFDVIRGQNITLLVENATGQQASQNITVPAFLNASNFAINVNASPNGSTLVVIASNSNGLNLEYSLNGTTWQTSNVFNGLLAGSYVLHVRDQLGCSFTKNFEANEFGIQSPYFYISKSNSLRFAKRITFGTSSNYKTDENTLSCESFSKDQSLAYKEIQQFKNSDFIATQFKSNYQNNTVKVIKSDDTEVTVLPTKMTSNIGIKDMRDAFKYNIGNGKTGIYFISGNTYDFDTSAASGTYALNGLLPEYAKVGNYIQLGAAWFEIEEIIFDEAKNADVIVISNNYTGALVSQVVGSIFNRMEYEVYEFAIDMPDYQNQYFRVKIEATDVQFDTITYLSEEIFTSVSHEKTLELRYRNTTNTDVFYATGIDFLIRPQITFIRGRIEEESEIHKTDDSTILLNASNYEVDEFVFEPVTKELWRKLTQALSHEKVFINGVGYVKSGNFNTEGPLEDSNLYVLTATMLKTGTVYNAIGYGSDDYIGSDIVIEVPGLITTDDGFLSY